MSFERRLRTYLHHKASTILIPPRTLQSLLKGMRLESALDDLRSMSGEERNPSDHRQERKHER